MNNPNKEQLKHLKALIVEDFEPMKSLIYSVLGMSGISSIKLAENGMQAKEILERYTPDVIISGWDMPRVSGLVLLKAVRKNKRLQNTPFVMLTTRADRDSVIEAIQAEVDAYLLKPFVIGSLVDTLINITQTDYVRLSSAESLAEKIVQHIESVSTVPNFTSRLSDKTAFFEEVNEPPADEKNGSGLVLIVDDTASNIDVINGILKGQYKTKIAMNGEKALELAELYTPDIILLDIMMPGIDGYEVCARLKKNDKTKNIPVIFVSALTDTVDIIKGFDAGAVDYMTKPVVPEILSAKVKTHINLAKSLNQ